MHTVPIAGGSTSAAANSRTGDHHVLLPPAVADPITTTNPRNIATGQRQNDTTAPSKRERPITRYYSEWTHAGRHRAAARLAPISSSAQTRTAFGTHSACVAPVAHEFTEVADAEAAPVYQLLRRAAGTVEL